MDTVLISIWFCSQSHPQQMAVVAEVEEVRLGVWVSANLPKVKGPPIKMYTFSAKFWILILSQKIVRIIEVWGVR